MVAEQFLKLAETQQCYVSNTMLYCRFCSHEENSYIVLMSEFNMTVKMIFFGIKRRSLHFMLLNFIFS